MNGVATATLNDTVTPVGNPAPFGGTSGYGQVKASSLAAQIQAFSGTTSLCSSSNVTLNAGSVYSVFLLGDIPATAGACVINPDH
jgi:hypothetical protein